MAEDANDLIRFSGLVVTFNEAKRLPDCLRSLSFCDELLVVDLGSADNSVGIATKMGARVVHHARVPYGEFARAAVTPQCRNDWIVRLDPDEVLPDSFEKSLRQVIASVANVALVLATSQFYFRGKPLKGTHWAPTPMPMAFDRRHSATELNVHVGFRVDEGYATAAIPDGGPATHVRHYWVDTYGQLLEKHRRYLRYEGKARFDAGDRFTWWKAFRAVLSALKGNLFIKRGIFCGPTGIFLSCFHCWYTAAAWMSLRRYQKHYIPAC